MNRRHVSLALRKLVLTDRIESIGEALKDSETFEQPSHPCTIKLLGSVRTPTV